MIEVVSLHPSLNEGKTLAPSKVVVLRNLSSEIEKIGKWLNLREARQALQRAEDIFIQNKIMDRQRLIARPRPQPHFPVRPHLFQAEGKKRILSSQRLLALAFHS